MAEFPEYNQEWEEGFNCAQDLKRDIRASDARIAALEAALAKAEEALAKACWCVDEGDTCTHCTALAAIRETRDAKGGE